MTPRLTFGAICVLALCAGSTAGAEENSIHAGATSVQFLVLGGSGSQPAFGTSGIFVKTHLSDRGALRVGADLYLSESTAKPGQLRRAENERYYAISVSAEFEEYVDATGPVTVFLGAGPYWTRSRSTSEYINVDTFNSTSYTFYTYYERSAWEVGGTAAVGFEWFFKRRLSMIGRAGASVGFGKSFDYQIHTTTYPTYQSEENRFEATTATAASSRAALGLALYF